jgi:hypothetical protein|tara:strand:- start:205 stop:348 length:144 start_codon:yes stop_codon:yes gene_type:complete
MLGGRPIKRKRLVYRFFANQFAGHPRDRIPSLETTPIGYAVIPERAE